jgi:hypothetical protein
VHRPEPAQSHQLRDPAGIRERSRRLSDGEMLGMLQRLFQARGYLSGLIIDETDHLPSSSAYQSRFGSLLRPWQPT